MQPIQDPSRLSVDTPDPRFGPRLQQADRFEILAAASEAEGICLIWIADRLAEREQPAP